MNAKELRIGNFINVTRTHGRGHKQTYVKEVNLHYLSQIDRKSTTITPIPLTEKWLIVFGFEECVDYYAIGKSMFFYDIHKSLENSEFYMFFDSESNSFNLSFMENDNNIRKELKIIYVHELQNLYFALTREELVFSYAGS